MTYRNLIFAAAISTFDHPVWQWLANRNGRVAGLSLELRLERPDASAARAGSMDELADPLPHWVQPLQILSGIPGLQLRVRWVGIIDQPRITQWLKQHGQLISHLAVEVFVSENRQKRREFSEAAAPCKFIDLKCVHLNHEVLDLADLGPVAGSLRCLTCQPDTVAYGSVRGADAFNSMSQLTSLHLVHEDLGNEEPWTVLATLPSLQQLRLEVISSGDPSPLSALTKLSALRLKSSQLEANDQAPFSFSSLQPLSTLQQLEVLSLGGQACTATSLQGLAGLSNLKRLGHGNSCTIWIKTRACSMLA
jgi:hypothetical protein